MKKIALCTTLFATLTACGSAPHAPSNLQSSGPGSGCGPTFYEAATFKGSVANFVFDKLVAQAKLGVAGISMTDDLVKLSHTFVKQVLDKTQELSCSRGEDGYACTITKVSGDCSSSHVFETSSAEANLGVSSVLFTAMASSPDVNATSREFVATLTDGRVFRAVEPTYTYIAPDEEKLICTLKHQAVSKPRIGDRPCKDERPLNGRRAGGRNCPTVTIGYEPLWNCEYRDGKVTDVVRRGA